ncbi:MAG: CotH kinase family protein [Candidatus Symbiothrix sp.]|jgi:hypothetical protein|nr:CotH kinase family protein [Candidatus Symbiothrix sp.]
MKYQIFFCSFVSLFSLQTLIAETVNIPAGKFGIDANKKLVVVNQNVSQLNENYPQSKTAISLNGALFTWNTPPANLSIGTAYAVKSAENVAYTLYFSELPLVQLTVSETIKDDPKVPGSIVISQNTSDSVLSENIGIELRGATAQTYPKKSYRFEFKDTTKNINKDIAVMGMHADDDWNLQALYIEPMRIRSKTGFDLWLRINSLHYQSEEPEAASGPLHKFVELFLNGKYEGVYCIGEPVSRKLLKLKKYNILDGMRGELYKGVEWGSGAVTFTALPSYTNGSLTWDGFEFVYPDEIASIWTNLYNFVDFVKNATDANFYADYATKFNLQNAVDYYLFFNLIYAFDNKGKNIFIAKQTTNKAYFYVPWDLDGICGIHWNGIKEGNIDTLLTNGMYDRLMRNKPDGSSDFKSLLKQKWNTLRESWLTTDSLFAMFRNNYDYLNNSAVYAREQKTGYTNYLDVNGLSYLSDWISHRLNYLDEKFNAYQDPTSAIANRQITGAGIVEVYDIYGILRRRQTIENQNWASAAEALPQGVYILRIADMKQLDKQIIKKIVK